jgi:hypothetical protein
VPILDVEIVGERLPTPLADLAPALARMAGEVLGCPPGRAWVRLRILPAEHYAENGPPLAPGDLPVFVTLLHREPPVGPALETEVAALTDGLACVLGRPRERMHLEYLPAARGRQSFGGRLVS